MSIETANTLHDYFSLLLIENPQFTGKIEVNLFGGGITNINQTQSIKGGDLKQQREQIRLKSRKDLANWIQKEGSL